MNSVMTHQFNQIPKVSVERSTFDRSHGYKTTFDEGFLIPIFVDEVLPGDTYNVRMNFFARLATQLRPIMDNMYLESFFFFVPYRILWSHWKNFMGEKVNPLDSTVYQVPTVASSASGEASGDIWDYFGLPVGVESSYQANALPFRAYNKIWNEWFRDQNLQNSLTESTGDSDSRTNYAIRRINKKHDYFTSALPWPQKGTAVSIPLGTSATVKTNATDLLTGAQNALLMRGASAGGNLTANRVMGSGASTNAITQGGESITPGGAGNLYPSNLYADLSTATAQTINALREAFQLQRLYERDARGGTRYVEIIKSHFGVTSPDFRQQRPELLGCGSSRVNVHPVAKTAQTIDSVEQDRISYAGQLAAFATVSGVNHGFTKSFTEHGVVMGLVAVRSDLTYSQGIERMWTRTTRFDFYWPALAHLGEQSILNKEIYFDGSGYPNDVWGYQERHAEYRYKKSLITGLFRSNVSSGFNTLDVWHLSQDFASQPTLDASFIEEYAPVDRVIAVQDEPHFYFDSFINMKCTRPMPVYSVPGMIDHF